MSSSVQVPRRIRTSRKRRTPSMARQHRLLRLADFANKVKIRFRCRDDVFAEFCETCSLCEENGEEWVFTELRRLFVDHQDLIAEFAELQSEGFVLIGGIKGFDRHAAFGGLGSEFAVANTHETPEMKGEGQRNSFLAPVKNVHKHALFDCEDDTCDLDVMIGLVRSAMSRMFPHRPDVFAAFCETCGLCEENGAEWVLGKLRDLFVDYQDLIAEFVELQLGVSAPVDSTGGSANLEAFSEQGKELTVLNTGKRPKIKGEETRSSFAAPVKKAHERVLFDCEDDMGDLDVMIGLARSAMSRIGSHLAAGPTGVCGLTAGELRCIRRMYGDQGDDVVGLMSADPARVLPIVLSRLQQKQDQWVAYRSNAREVWKKALAEHHRPSLGRGDTNTITVEASVYAGSGRSCPPVEPREEATENVSLNVGAVEEELGQLEAQNRQIRIPRSCSVSPWLRGDRKQIKGSVSAIQSL